VPADIWTLLRWKGKLLLVKKLAERGSTGQPRVPRPGGSGAGTSPWGAALLGTGRQVKAWVQPRGYFNFSG